MMEVKARLYEQEIKTNNIKPFFKAFVNTAENFIKEQPLFYDKNSIWWWWNLEKFKWEVIDETDLMNKFDNSEQSNYIDTIKSNVKNEILESLKRVSRKNKPEEGKKTWIQFQNKIIDFENGDEFEATPKYLITNPIPHEIGYSEETPIIDKIFEEWVGKDYVQTLYEIISYCSCSDQFLQMLVALTGAGSNGKGTFLNLVSNFIGNDNVCSSELKLLSTRNFETSSLYKKLLCTVGEVDIYDLKSTNLIKSLTGQDLIRYEFKGKTPFSDYSPTTIIIATNSLPITPDKSIGFYRRILIIDFPNQFSVKRDVLAQIPKIEYNNLSRKIVRILKELYIKNEFTNSGTIESRTNKYEEKSNPIISFLSECCEDSIGEMVTLKEFTKYFNEFLTKKHLRPLTVINVGKIIRDNGYDIKPRNIFENNDKTSARVILNLKLTTKTTQTTVIPNYPLRERVSNNISSLSSFSSLTNDTKVEEVKL